MREAMIVLMTLLAVNAGKALAWMIKWVFQIILFLIFCSGIVWVTIYVTWRATTP